MSELYNVVVEAVGADHVTMRVRTVHPDAGPPPEAPTFPMNLLVDLWWLLERGYSSQVVGAELGEEQAVALAKQAPWAATMQQLKDLSHGLEAPITEVEYEALNHGGALPERFADRHAASWGMSDGQYQVTLRGDEEAFGEACAALVSSYEQEEKKNQDAYENWPAWPEPATPEAMTAYRNREPTARLRITLKKPGLLGFVRAGMSFDTAAYY